MYRTVREAVINCARHSRAKHVRVDVSGHGDRIDGSITDDGVGFDPKAVRRRDGAELHLGLPALAERLRLVNGWLKIESRPGYGTVVTFSVPTL